MKKNILNVIVIALVISVAGTLVTSLIVNKGNVLASPPTAPKNANECTLDNSCEVNAISSRSGEILLSGDARVTGDLLVDGVFSDKDIECDKLRNYNDEVSDTFCRSQGYDFCLIEENEVGKLYYTSSDGTCTGDIQLWINIKELAKCREYRGAFGSESCGTARNGAAEPHLGDGKLIHNNSRSDVICCR